MMNAEQEERKRRLVHHSVQDSSYLCEIISRELFEAAGIPVPRADHATVIVNGIAILFMLGYVIGKRG